MLLAELTERGIPALTETPPAPDLDGLRRLAPLARGGARIQVAEQYQFQPIHAARIAIARSGRLGTVSHVQVSAAHGYHGVDLIRRLLADEFGPVTIRARRFESTIVAGPDRAGPPVGERIVPSSQVIATLEFDGPSAVFDFSEDQYFSWVRSNRVLVRGERGEIHDTTVRYLRADGSPAIAEIRRHETGRDSNFEGLGLVGHHAGRRVGGTERVPRRALDRRRRLTDDELAIATCLVRMAEYLDGGPDFCSLADGVHDHHLGLAIDAAAESGEAVRVAGHLWDEGG